MTTAAKPRRGKTAPEPLPEIAPEAAAALGAYLAHLSDVRRRSEYTIRNYRTDLEDYLRFLSSRQSTLPTVAGAPNGIAFDAAGRSDGRSYLSRLADIHLAEGSIRRRATTIRGFYGWLDANEVPLRARPGDSMLRLRYPKKGRRLPHFLDVEEAQRLVDAPDLETVGGLRDHAILELLWGAGLRVSEASNMDVRDLDLTNLQARVTGKGDKTRICLYGEPARSAIRTYLDDARPLLATGAQTALFLNRAGGRLTARSIQTIVRNAGMQAALRQGVHPHLLRHSFATHMIEGGADLRVVQHLLGHSSPDTTQIYTTVAHRRKAEFVGDALERARSVEHRRARVD
ncbi:MAG: recombinase XerC [Chloroflexi bacterium]|nr:MAG: recombinase XerC [Chloroflexota bacterium]